jgi:hypothetical protein
MELWGLEDMMQAWEGAYQTKWAVIQGLMGVRACWCLCVFAGAYLYWFAKFAFVH